jgi:phenylacetate-coenzyme A ligase PaaK-like adenylate-forming protein
MSTGGAEMYIDDLRQLEQAMRAPEMLELSIDYLAENMKKFLRPGDKLMLCFTTKEPDNIGDLLSLAAQKIGVTVLIPDDLRWKTMLKLAFRSRVTAISAPPFVVLGLTKLARHTKTPLYFRNVITVAYRCTNWIIDGIQKGLDCQVWGCYGPGSGPLVSGFSCNKEPVIHVRDDLFEVEIVDEAGKTLTDGESGYVVLTPKQMPHLRYHTAECARMRRTPCACGCNSPLLMDMYSGEDVDPMMEQLGRELMSWTSILDCRLGKGEYGLELELVTFPGEKLPKLPTCAKQVVRNWDPDTDVPNWFAPDWRKRSDKG